jgi:hypothetical protein
MSKQPKTILAKVNRKLAELGYSERLRRGKDYYFFVGGNTPYWPDTAVYVNRADSLTVESWLREHKALSSAAHLK